MRKARKPVFVMGYWKKKRDGKFVHIRPHWRGPQKTEKPTG